MKKLVFLIFSFMTLMSVGILSASAHHGYGGGHHAETQYHDEDCCYYDADGCGFTDCECLCYDDDHDGACDACERIFKTAELRDGFKPGRYFTDEDHDGICDNHASSYCHRGGRHHYCR